DVFAGAQLRTGCGRIVRAAPRPARYASPVPLPGISLATGAVCDRRFGVDGEYCVDKAVGVADWSRDYGLGIAGIFLLAQHETEERMKAWMFWGGLALAFGVWLAYKYLWPVLRSRGWQRIPARVVDVTVSEWDSLPNAVNPSG